TITPRNVAINTQKIALNALAFLYNQFLQQPLGDLDFTFATKPRRLPEVLSTRGCSYSARIGRHIQPAGCHYITLNPDTLPPFLAHAIQDWPITTQYIQRGLSASILCSGELIGFSNPCLVCNVPDISGWFN